MKTLTKTTIAAAIALVMTITTNGCKKEDMNNPANAGNMTAAKEATTAIPPQAPGTLELKMVSIPAKGLGAVNVEITGVMVHYANASFGIGNRGWVTVPVKDNIYDLQEFHDGKYVVLGVDNRMPAGKIDEIRLVLGQKNTVVKGDADGRHSYQLTVSGANHNAELKADIVLQKSNRLVVTVDFNAQRSVNFEGQGTYILTPSLDLKDIEYVPMISNQ
jgi:hypothetical protein